MAVNNWAEKFGFSREEAPMGGIPTLQARQRVFNNNMEQDKFDWLKTFQEAGLTGMYDGNKTWGRTVDESNLTGQFEGNDTFAREKFNDSSALGWANHALSKDRNALSREQFDWNKAIQEAQAVPEQSGLPPELAQSLYNLSKQVVSGEMAYEDAVKDIQMLASSQVITPEQAQQMIASLTDHKPAPTPEKVDDGTSIAGRLWGGLLENTHLGNNLDELGIDHKKVTDGAQKQITDTAFKTMIPASNPYSPTNWAYNLSKYMPWNQDK
jgi:hypothetical protein